MEQTSESSVEALSAGAALQLVSPFFRHEWPQTRPDDVNLEKVTGGFVNRLFKLTRHTEAVLEPSSVLIRFFGVGGTDNEPKTSSTTLSSAEQAIIYFEMGRRGWGPKLYGTFPGGRIEEYIQSHTLTPAECMDPILRRDIARSYARIHTLELPLPKSNFRLVLAEFMAAASDMENLLKHVRVKESPIAVKLRSILDTLDLKDELEWVAGLFDTYDCRSAIAIVDTNFLNVLVKEYESECGIVLIDYETATYGYRGIDIGGHWNERMYQWRGTASLLTEYPLPSTEDRRAFCEAYVEELRSLKDDGTTPASPGGTCDTVDHVMLEGDIGQLYQTLFSVMTCLMWDPNMESDMMEALTVTTESYCQLKADFQAARSAEEAGKKGNSGLY